MNLVKWLRKNNTKIMAVVVIIIFFGFIGGSSLRYLLQPSQGLHKTIAYFEDNRKITNRDILSARRELEILMALKAPDILKSLDLHGVFLSELLFSEVRSSPILINQIKSTIRANQYRISDRQLSDIYRRTMPTDIYWLLLRNEAELAGIKIPNEEVGRLLGQAIPQLFQGQTYSQVISALVSRMGIPERQVLATLGKLIAVWQYAQMICSAEDITSSQIKHTASWENETIDVQYVRFDSAVFAKVQDLPSEEKIVEHFNRYKGFFAGDFCEENPYGFGYKLPDRVQLEYIAIKLDDASKIISPPTEEEAEQYYQRNREKLFTDQVPADSNDPNSPLIEQTKTYAEVASTIFDQLLWDKINTKAEQILQEAKAITQAPSPSVGVDSENPREEPEIEKVSDFHEVAERLNKKYGIKLYAGHTGLLSAIDIQMDKYLSSLYIARSQYNPVRLSQIVFSIDQLQVNNLGVFDIQKPTMYECIGPLKSLLAQMTMDTSGQIMAIVRIIKVEKAAKPENIDLTYSTKTIELDNIETQDNEAIFSVREKVTEDLKKLAALNETKSKAEEFAQSAAANGWETVIDKFNELYRQNATDPNDPNIFKLESRTDLQRISGEQFETLAMQSASNPASRVLMSEAKATKQFVNQIYSLVPPDSNTVDELPLVMDFKPNMSFYVIKDISVKRLNQEEFEKIKATQLARQEHIQSQSLAAVHFNPENILKRMNFRPAQRDREQPDVESSSNETEDTS